MHDIFTALILGLVEGVTEFLPVSSTGHLILVGEALSITGRNIAAFDIIIQLGAILAVVVLYRDRFTGLLRTDPDRAFSGPRGLWLLFLTTLPASLLGLALHGVIKTHLFTPFTVALALAAGAVVILLLERLPFRHCLRSVDRITTREALIIGCFQCLALWPGFSRSAATIIGGLICGADRTTAARYSFLAAVPVMVAATGYELLSSWSLFSSRDLWFLSVGFVTAFLSALVAVKAFVALLQRMTLVPFAWYRLALAGLVLLAW